VAPERWLADLEGWLSVGQVPAPYLLVGHSLGGHIVRAFAARHPADVMGMILVDARHEDLYPGLPQPFLARLAELSLAWQLCQRDLTATSSRSTFRGAVGSGHMIPVDQPGLVVGEIRSMIGQFQQASKR
jgi:pimeloyl-ACP methyl ester carboxylesterase